MNPAEYLNETRQLISSLDWRQIDAVLQELQQCRKREGRLFLIGNGGGAGYASHAAADFRKFGGLQAWAYDNLSEMTARINDEGWDTCISDWLKASKADQKDLIFCFSVGGGSKTTSNNLVQAMVQLPTRVVGIVGQNGGTLRDVAECCIVVPSISTAQIESCQAVLFHLLSSCM